MTDRFISIKDKFTEELAQRYQVLNSSDDEEDVNETDKTPVKD